METGTDHYEICIEGHLGASWVTWFEGLTIRHLDTGHTLLSGPIEDQSALHGVLIKIRDLGLPLVTVKRITPEDGSRNRQPQAK